MHVSEGEKNQGKKATQQSIKPCQQLGLLHGIASFVLAMWDSSLFCSKMVSGTNDPAKAQ